MVKTIILALSVFCSAAYGSSIKINVEGSITQLDSIFSGLLEYGDDMKATFQYDPASVSRISNFEPNRAFHYFDEFFFSVEMGELNFSGIGGRAEVTHDYLDSSGRIWDRYILQTGGVATFYENELADYFDIANISASITFYDFTGNDAISDTKLPSVTEILSFDTAPNVSIQINVDDGVFDWLPMFARSDEVEVIAVSEPKASLIIMPLLIMLIIRVVLFKKSPNR
ncbi:hypothetical protein [Brumicola pallidula]|uniref:Uncharacterized protein n=1 Tax=Brumicola pallidula DSM 14239 = ACAM 615 TaxID=1121922 RepID=K6YX79_9ALTE|nr:hypothetical protein [Glaciecola pallidula]GAC28601.1 hypothetical protein GPAL_1738 [Glaciecola pallidula DSM 14239 = ACAM 615]